MRDLPRCRPHEPTYSSKSFTSSLTASSWYHIVLMWSTAANQISGWIDGAAAFTDTAHSLWPTTMPSVKIGTGFAGSDRWFQGTLDEVAIWTRRLSPSEVTTLHASGVEAVSAVPEPASAAAATVALLAAGVRRRRRAS